MFVVKGEADVIDRVVTGRTRVGEIVGELSMRGPGRRTAACAPSPRFTCWCSIPGDRLCSVGDPYSARRLSQHGDRARILTPADEIFEGRSPTHSTVPGTPAHSLVASSDIRPDENRSVPDGSFLPSSLRSGLGRVAVEGVDNQLHRSVGLAPVDRNALPNFLNRVSARQIDPHHKASNFNRTIAHIDDVPGLQA